MMDTTVLESTVATWMKDRNPKQLPAVARNATPLKTRVFGVVRRKLSGRGGAADPHGRTERSGINSRQLVTGSPRAITFACDRTARFGTCGQNGEAAGLAPAVLHVVQLSADGTRPIGGKSLVAGDLFEGAYPIKRNGAYYLFVSSGSCCDGINNTYQVEVARASELTGEYRNEYGPAVSSIHTVASSSITVLRLLARAIVP